MLYVQQSLNPDEEIVRVGHFHWWYTFSASIWIVIGLGIMIGFFYAGYYWEVSQTVKTSFALLPPDLYDQAWDDTVARMGGMFKIMLSQHIAIKAAGFIAFLMGLLFFVQMMIVKHTTEICLTSDRLVLKRGLISRMVEEINVDRIEGVDVFQGILGRILGFGNISVRGMGVGEITIPPIEHPVDFRKSIEHARSVRGT